MSLKNNRYLLKLEQNTFYGHKEPNYDWFAYIQLSTYMFSYCNFWANSFFHVVIFLYISLFADWFCTLLVGIVDGPYYVYMQDNYVYMIT